MILLPLRISAETQGAGKLTSIIIYAILTLIIIINNRRKGMGKGLQYTAAEKIEGSKGYIEV